jgi:adipocyte plasma membrane-associated protein
MSYLKCVGTAFIYIGLFLAVITFMPGLPPYTEFKEFRVTPPIEVEIKDRLNGAQKLFEDEIYAPESFASYNGQLYTGVHGGYILRIEENRVVPIVKFGEKCDGIWQEHKCGRPLGLQFDKEGNLYALDAFYGVFKVNVATGEYKNLVNISKPIDGRIPRFPNSVDVAENGDIYWTDSMLDLNLSDIMSSFLVNPSGRLIRYNAAKKKNEVLMRDLAIANGIKLSDDESFVIVSESQQNRIMKYNLKGPKAGQQEVFIDGLPGIPDNIHTDGQGGFLVTLIVAVDSEHPQLFQSLGPHPYLRKMLIRLLMLIELPFKLLHDIYPNVYAEKLVHAIGSFQGSQYVIRTYEKSLVLRMDTSGNIIEAVSSNDGSVYFISSAYIHNDFLWFGSPWLKYLLRVPLKQAFPTLVDSTKQSSRTSNEKQLPNAAASDIKIERVKRNADSTTTKSTAAPTTTKPTAAPTTPKPTAAPKPSSAPKADKPTDTSSDNVKPSGTKSNAEAKKDRTKTVDTKSNTKSEENSKKDDATKAQSGKNAKVEQDASAKQKAQKSQPEKTKRVETNRPKDDL